MQSIRASVKFLLKVTSIELPQSKISGDGVDDLRKKNEVVGKEHKFICPFQKILNLKYCEYFFIICLYKNTVCLSCGSRFRGITNLQLRISAGSVCFETEVEKLAVLKSNNRNQGHSGVPPLTLFKFKDSSLYTLKPVSSSMRNGTILHRSSRIFFFFNLALFSFSSNFSSSRLRFFFLSDKPEKISSIEPLRFSSSACYSFCQPRMVVCYCFSGYYFDHAFSTWCR